MLSICGGLLKNSRGKRSLRLKLEIDERITVSLSENNRARHEGPYCRYHPRGGTHHCCFEVAIAQGPMHKNHARCDKPDLKYFAGGEDRAALGMSPKHALQHSPGTRKFGGRKKNPGNTHSSKG